MMAGSLARIFLWWIKTATRALSSYRGRWVVLYFYPKDDTPGCTTEACQFRDDYAAVQRLGADILGVSIDNRASHAAFSKKFSLPFPLLADTDGRVAKQYGALWGVWPLKFERCAGPPLSARQDFPRSYREVDPQVISLRASPTSRRCRPAVERASSARERCAACV